MEGCGWPAEVVQPVNDTQTYEELREQGAVFKNTDMLIVFFLVQNLLSLISSHLLNFGFISITLEGV